MTDDTSRQSILDRLFDYVHSRVDEQLKSVCPSKKIKPKKECKPGKAEEKSDIGSSCTEKRTHILPSQICPKTVSCCYIKMQDPYAPCCCEIKSQPSPCPPKCHRRQPRELTCGCDLCRKDVDSKCCGSTAAFHSAARDSRYFKRA